MKLLLTQCNINLEVGEVRWEDGRVGRLTTREVSLLRYLSTRMGVDVSRDELHAEVWGHGAHTVSRAADDTVRRLRPKIELDSKDPRHLLTVHGEGYRLLGTIAQDPSPTPVFLPQEHLPIVGRAALIHAVKEALEVSRLVTLVGPGGVGKTRLAIHIAHELEGVGFLDLSEARTLEAFSDQIASQLHLNEPEDVQALAQRLAKVEGLVILDNLEQVAEPAAAILQAWLKCPGEGRILMTSRARLGLSSERVIAVKPLDEGHGVAVLRQQLKVLGVGTVEDSKLFALHRAVEGLPFALELAAARVGGLGIDRVLERLQADPTNLTAFRHTGPERHRSVRATVQWSWELLDPVEQRVLSQAAVFRGGVNLHALEVALDGQLPPDRDVDDCVAVLVEHALLTLEKRGRFRLPLAVREVAQSALKDREEALRRHTIGMVASIDVYWRNSVRALADLEGLRFLTEERQNLLCVLDRVRGQDVDHWCKIVLCLGSLWHSGGMVRRAREELTLAVEACGSSRYAPHLLFVLGGVLRAMDPDVAVDVLERACAGLKEPQDRHMQLLSLIELVMIAADYKDSEALDRYLKQAETLIKNAPELGYELEFCRSWIAFTRGCYEEALGHVQSVQTVELNTIRRFTVDLIELVILFNLNREEATAERFQGLSEEALRLGDVFKQAFALSWVGRAEVRRGEHRAAAQAFVKAEMIYRRGGADEWANTLHEFRQQALAWAGDSSTQ